MYINALKIIKIYDSLFLAVLGSKACIDLYFILDGSSENFKIGKWIKKQSLIYREDSLSKYLWRTKIYIALFSFFVFEQKVCFFMLQGKLKRVIFTFKKETVTPRGKNLIKSWIYQ